MEFEVVLYIDKKGNSPIEEFLLKLEKGNRALVARTRESIRKIKNRAYHKAPLSKYLEPGLWELRIKSASDILRILYTFNEGKLVILLHVFIKKQQKTPHDEILLARKRLQELKEEENKNEKKR